MRMFVQGETHAGCKELNYSLVNVNPLLEPGELGPTWTCGLDATPFPRTVAFRRNRPLLNTISELLTRKWTEQSYSRIAVKEGIWGRERDPLVIPKFSIVVEKRRPTLASMCYNGRSTGSKRAKGLLLMY